MNSDKDNPSQLLEDENPFVRNDRYGELGLAPQPLLERVRLLFFAVFLVPLKLAGILASLLSFFAVVKASLLFPEKVRSEWVAKLGKMHCRFCLFCLGFVHVRCVSVGEDTETPVPPVVGIVSNHVSWVDIIVHMSHSFPAFVARDATKNTPIIGSISQAMGCIYVDRVKRSGDSVNGQTGVAATVRDRMSCAAQGKLPHARPMLLFPEGTTTNGQYLLPFKTGAFLAGVPLRPVVLLYEVRGVSPAWESISAVRHVSLMLMNPTHAVTCHELPVYVPSEEERANPRLYADNMRSKMIEFLGLKDSKLTFEDKLIYVEKLKKKYGLVAAAAPSTTDGAVEEPEC